MTRLAAAGAPARSIMELVGHTMLSTTLRYMHMMPGEASRAVSILEGFDQRTHRGAPVGVPPDQRQA